LALFENLGTLYWFANFPALASDLGVSDTKNHRSTFANAHIIIIIFLFALRRIWPAFVAILTIASVS